MNRSNPDRLAAQFQFLTELEKLKSVIRKSPVMGTSRRENSAEHSWHVVMIAMILMEYSNVPVDTMRVIKMLAIHDIVEIDAGDVFHFHKPDNDGGKELAAAERIFGLLPPDQGAELRSLWEEFEAGETAEAKFALGIDRVWPCIQNYYTAGGSWRDLGVSRTQVVAKCDHVAEGSHVLWDYLSKLVDEMVTRGDIAA